MQEKLLSAASYNSTPEEGTNENGKLTSKSTLNELGPKNGRKFLCISLDTGGLLNLSLNENLNIESHVTSD